MVVHTPRGACWLYHSSRFRWVSASVPDGGSFPGGGNGGAPEGFGSFGGTQSASLSTDSLIMLGVCLAVLLVGVVLAWRYRAAR